MNRIVIFFLFPMFMFSQNDFYIGFGSITTFAQLKDGNNYSEKENIDYGLYYGNNLKWTNKFMTTLEVFYLNQKVILNQSRSSRFELHQNIGFGIKPGFYSGKHSVHLSAGILGVYVFDKKEGTWLYWYLNGNNQELKTYRNGKLDGPIKQWYSNGQKKIIGHYKELSKYEARR